MKKRVLVIGGDSFIARQFYALFRDAFEFVIVSRKPAYQGIEEIILEDLFEVQQSLFKGIDAVINFAAIVHNPEIRDRTLFQKINVDLPVNLATMAGKGGVSQFIQMSSVSVYGNKQFIDINTAAGPVTLYGKSKLDADKELQQLNRDGFQVLSIRPPMVYGGGNAPGNMMRLMKLVRKMQYGIPLPLGVPAKKSFIHVKNLADFIYHATFNSLSGIYLVCDAEDISMKDLTGLICRELGIKSLSFSPGKLLLSVIRRYSSDLYNSLYQDQHIEGNYQDVGFTPKYRIEEGIAEMAVTLKKR